MYSQNIQPRCRLNTCENLSIRFHLQARVAKKHGPALGAPSREGQASFVGTLRGPHARNAHRDPPNVRERTGPALERPGLRMHEAERRGARAAPRARTLASTTLRNCSGSAAPVPLGREVPLAPLSRSLCTKLGRGSPAPDAKPSVARNQKCSACMHKGKEVKRTPPSSSLPPLLASPSFPPSFHPPHLSCCSI